LLHPFFVPGQFASNHLETQPWSVQSPDGLEKFLRAGLAAREQEADSPGGLAALQRSYECQCSRPVFFRNSQCLSCNTPLGYVPELGHLFPLIPGPQPGTWQLTGAGVPDAQTTVVYRRCSNLQTVAGCNWLVSVDPLSSSEEVFCRSCRLDRTIPDLSDPGNGVLWQRLEAAKRRVISALIALGLPVASRVSEDIENGVAFDFLRSPANGPRVLTGHDNGLITINIEEADDVRREQIRTVMREPYRTLVGHFRHEIGHYYWDRLIADRPHLDSFRELFGDEQADYTAALQRNYENGPRPDWAEHFVSAYASVHPWEDWAETWAHYLHMVDALGTASSFGLRPETIPLMLDRFDSDALGDTLVQAGDQFLPLLHSWLKLTAVMNELCRSMGQPDFYPFALPRAAVSKLHFIHKVVQTASFKIDSGASN
jgi:hypothetical protein